MSASWSRPDPPARVVVGTAFGVPYERLEPEAPPLRHDLRAALLTVVFSVLAGGPVGLLWAQVAPRVRAEAFGDDVLLVDSYTDSFIAADAGFLAATALAGLIGGLLAWRAASAHGPAVVISLAFGGLLAAFVAMTAGQELGQATAREAAAAAAGGRFDLPLEIQAREALVGWPLASLLGYLGACLARGR